MTIGRRGFLGGLLAAAALTVARALPLPTQMLPQEALRPAVNHGALDALSESLKRTYSQKYFHGFVDADSAFFKALR